MPLFAITHGNRSLLGCIAVSSYLGLAFIGCGGSSTGAGNGGSAGDDDPSAAGGGGSGGTQAQGGKAGSGLGQGGAGGDVGGRAGVGGAGPAGDAGSDGVAGSSGDAGSAGVAGAGGAGAESCVNVSGGGKEPWYELTVVGAQYEADEGARMRVVVATQTGNRVGIAELPIVGGAFALSMPGVLNAGLYVGVTLYIDRNDNDTCEPDEHAWDWTTRTVLGDMRFDVTPDEMCDRTLMSCRPWESPQAACWVGTGDTDLSEPLPCNP